MFLDISGYVVVIAVALDFILGDPDFAWHPIRLMGAAISRAETGFRRLPVPPFAGGLLLAAVLVAGAWAGTYLILFVAESLAPLLADVLAVGLLYFCISARGLEKAAMSVYRWLAENNPDRARSELALIVGRDVDNLSDAGLARAAVETVAENLVDGVISPLFFAVIGGVPLAVAFKMVNTLDSMVGYKNERYREFGKASARIDDAANFIPARLAVVFIAAGAAILFGKGGAAFLTAVRQGGRHSSPNAGYPEAAFAGALSVWLGGPNYYRQQRVDKPVIGEGLAEAAPAHIPRACRLMRASAILGFLVAVVICFF